MNTITQIGKAALLRIFRTSSKLNVEFPKEEFDLNTTILGIDFFTKGKGDQIHSSIYLWGIEIGLLDLNFLYSEFFFTPKRNIVYQTKTLDAIKKIRRTSFDCRHIPSHAIVKEKIIKECEEGPDECLKTIIKIYRFSKKQDQEIKKFLGFS